jgi:hypothetical protein
VLLAAAAAQAVAAATESLTTLASPPPPSPRQPFLYSAHQVLFGLVTVVIGLFIFIEGVKIGVMPLAAELGTHLPRQLPLAGVLAVVFVLGCGATLAEPAMGALRNLGSLISYRRSPLLKVRAGAGAGAGIRARGEPSP